MVLHFVYDALPVTAEVVIYVCPVESYEFGLLYGLL